MIRFECPSCDKSLKVKDAVAGMRSSCPACGTKLRIPEASTTADSATENPSRSSPSADSSARASAVPRAPVKPAPAPEEREDEVTPYRLAGLDEGKAAPEPPRRRRVIEEDDDDDEDDDERRPIRKKKHRQRSEIGPAMSSIFGKVGAVVGSLSGLLFILVVVLRVFTGVSTVGNAAKAEDHAKQAVAKMNELNGVLRTVRDANSARVAAPRVRAIIADMAEIVKKERSTPLRQSDKVRLEQQYNPQIDAAGAAFKQECERIAMIPGAAAELESAFAEAQKLVNVR